MPAGLRCNRQFEDALPHRWYGDTDWTAIFPNNRRMEVDTVGTNVRRAYTDGTFPYKSVPRCTLLSGATLMQADSEGTLSERSMYEVLEDNAGCL